MEKLRICELFSGIGAQVEGIANTGLYEVEVVATAEIDKEAMVSYASVHNGLDLGEEVGLTDAEMREELMSRGIGMTEKGTNPIERLRGTALKRYYLAMKKSKNLGDICKIERLPEVDFLTYSSPCTDYSFAGKRAGGNWKCLGCGTEYAPLGLSVDERYTCPKCGGGNIKSTRSGLLFEVERLLVRAKADGQLPKYLLLENVKALVSKKFKGDFDSWIDRLEAMGYNTYYTVLNAKDCGIPQNRERVFAVSIRKDIDTGKFVFPKPFDSGLRLKDMLEDKVEDKYYSATPVLDDFIKNNPQIDLSTAVQDTGKGGNTIQQLGNIQYRGSWVNRQRDRVYRTDGIGPCLQVFQGGGLVPKMLVPSEKPTRMRLRRLTPTECWRLMGFTDDEVERARANGVSDTQLYKQAGNSIVTDCISLIMEHIYKAQYDSDYECVDEEVLRRQVAEFQI